MNEKPAPEQVEILRAAVAARVKATSLRGAAREIGMSPSGLQKFLSGTGPYEPTLRRLLAWYGDDAAQRERDEAIARVLGLLPAQRRVAGEAILRALLAGPVRGLLALDEALSELEAPEDRTRLARGLSRLAERSRGRPAPAGASAQGIEGAVILGALVELLAAELPQNAALRLNGRTVRWGALLAALREYADGVT